ncbi:unnamed protein product [Acanthocheilonema viteae]|uniref:Uncharacterized protein n=1 Tax=Acanthocheilonema viteae TaxID=6277 RepID=A0A498SE63_ACAVI|nr:unnamed protein product [Acanthocheilonema viteae]
MITSIECSANDIAQLLRYIALYGEFKEDEIHRTSRTFIRLVSRGKTKFDEGGKKARKKELSDELDCDSGAKRSSKKGNAMVTKLVLKNSSQE